MKHKALTLMLPLLVAAIAASCGIRTALAGQIPSTPDGTIMYVSEHLADGHPEVLWEALPDQYRKDINGLTHLFATKVDPELWNKSFSVMQKAATVLHDKKDLFLGSQLFAMAGENKDTIAGNWDTGTSVFGTLVNSDISNLETLKKMDWGRFLASTGAELMTMARDSSKATDDDAYQQDFVEKLKGTSVKVIEETAETATVEVTAPGKEPETTSMTKVDGRWVPTDMAKDWDAKVAEAQAKLEAITPEAMAEQKVQAMMMLGMAEAMVDQIAQAETSEQLDQMLQGLLGGLLGGGMGGGMGGATDEGAETAQPSGS